ncbi:MAG: glycerol-3-phosphate dehydrogenase/oxidase, partial [Chloroflexota bacterium]|nr:glycerol-3-phosphate dehydrogenase/oxidase [Chloroflexota bacterium]
MIRVDVGARRERTFARLDSTAFDALVVGGGIVGTGIARDLTLRGLRVALVEQRDLASGTSSRPTRLIHGGLRYLEILDFGLVRTDMREREVLLRLAPHLVQPLPFLTPMYDRGVLYRAKLQAGMQLYDALSYDKSLPTRQWLNRRQVLRAEPGLNASDLQGAWQFYDGQVSLVERLVIENALDAAGEGAVIATHAPATGFLRDPAGAVVGARVRDTLGHREVDVRARLTINATGPWLDLTSASLRSGARPLLRLTKGVHLVTPAATRHAHVLFAPRDGRLFFVIPWLGYSLVGTTDTDYQGDPARASATQEDIEYLLDQAHHFFPSAPFQHILYTYAGVRALVRVAAVKEGKVSRKHALHDHGRRDGVAGIVSVVGGKITGYRAIAEEVGRLVARRLGQVEDRGSITQQRPLPGGKLANLEDYVELSVWPRAQRLGLGRDQARHLGCVYGSLAPEVLALAEQDPRLTQRVCASQPSIAAELARAVADEWAVSIGDVLLRRTP